MTKGLSAGRLKVVWAFLLLFAPALILIFLGTRGCDHKFKELDDYGKAADYKFTTAEGATITSETLKDKIILVNVLQDNCVDTCNIAYWHLDQLIYQKLRKNKNEANDVRIISIVTDKQGKQVEDIAAISALLKDKIEAYDPEIWMVVKGDPKQLYNTKFNGVSLMQDGKELVGGKTFMHRMLLLDRRNHLRMVRSGEVEAYVREIYGHMALLLKHYDKEAARK